MKGTRKTSPPPDLSLLRIDRLSAGCRRSEELARHDRENRDAAIGRADELGFGVRAIWRATGKTDDERLSISHVNTIILHQAAKRQSDQK